MIEQLLRDNCDTKYAEFQRKLIPNIDPESIIGVRTPMLKTIAKQLKGSEEAEIFMNSLPHKYFEENQLHSFLISQMKDEDECLKRYKEFIPYIDNWATSDQLSPVIFKKKPALALELVDEYLHSGQTYIIRTGVDILMSYYLDELFEEKYLFMVADVESQEYYVNMMRAWYYATALAKQYDSTVKLIQDNKLDLWTHNKTIQKAIESNRISDSQKEYLRSLRRKV